MLRWGLIGAGTQAARAVAPAMRAAGHDLAVVAARSLTRAQGFAANHGVRRARGDYREALDARDVDAVYIGLPNALHEEWTVAALEAGKHVLVARPLAVDAEGAARMAAAAAAAGDLVLMEAAVTRFHPRTSALLELVRTGGIGAVRLVAAGYSYPMTAADSFRARSDLGGGALLDLGADLVALARWVIAEEPELVRGVSRRWATGVDGTSSAALAFGNGAQATVAVSFDGVPHEAFEVVGTEGTLRLPRAFSAGANDQAALLRGDDVLGTWRADPYERMITAFNEAVAGKERLLDADDAVATAHVLDWIRASWQ